VVLVVTNVVLVVADVVLVVADVVLVVDVVDVVLGASVMSGLAPQTQGMTEQEHGA